MLSGSGASVSGKGYIVLCTSLKPLDSAVMLALFVTMSPTLLLVIPVWPLQFAAVSIAALESHIVCLQSIQKSETHLTMSWEQRIRKPRECTMLMCNTSFINWLGTGMQGLVFGVGTDKGVVKLFDVRSYAQGPFDAFTVRLS